MFPGYGYMDSYPKPHFYQNPHMPYHHPSWEVKPEHVSPSYAPWSCSSSFGYPSPMQCHGCCNPMYHPGYYSARLPYPHLPPPSPLCHQGPYSPSEPYPPCAHHYQVPPYRFMELPRYEYDKDMNGKHCCGCHKKNEDKGVKLEEHEPESRKESRSLAPVKMGNNYPYPFVWVPPECLKEGSAKQAEEEKQNGSQKDEGEKYQFPFPLYWLPAHGKSEDSGDKDKKEINPSEQPVKFKIIPVNFSIKDDHKGKLDVMEDKNRDRVLAKEAEKDVQTITIPMKPVGEIEISKEENEKKSSNDNLKNQSSSPKKGSKLPPVCLRVDPLPRRRSGNGTSRSPSPPGVKSNANQSSDRTNSTSMPTKESSGQTEQVSPQNKVEEEQAKKKIEVRQSQGHAVAPDVSNSFEESSRMPTTAKEDMPCEKKKKLSDAEAAVLVQSFYRGFEVRRWEPLKKLRQIAKLREQASQIRERLETLKSSTGLQKVEKEKLLIGVSIMSLLLQLDTIHGLHPTVRDIRKSLATELVCLQEGLDSLVIRTASEEDKSVVVNSSEASLQETDKLSLHPAKLPVKSNSGSGSHVEEMEAAKEVMEATEMDSAVSGECPSVADTKVEPRTNNHTVCVGEGMEIPQMDSKCDMGHLQEELPQEMRHEMSPKIDDKQVLLQGKSDSLVETIVNEETPDSALQGKGFNNKMEDILASQVEQKEHDDAECVTRVLPAESTTLQDRSANSIANKAVASEMVDNTAEVTTETPRLEDSVEMVEGDCSEAASLAVEEEHSENATQAEMQDEASEIMTGTSCLEDSVEMVDGDCSESAPTIGYKQVLLPGKETPSDAESVEVAAAEQDSALEKQGSYHVIEDVLEDDARCLTKIAREKPPLDTNAETVSENEDWQGKVATYTAEDDIASEMMEGKHEDVGEAPQAEGQASETTEILDNGVYFHDKDVISESASSKKELEISSGIAETEEAKQVVPVKGEAVLNKEKGKELMEENEKLRVLLVRLLQEGKEQLNAISNLSGRVKDLERQLAKKKKLRMRKQRHRAPKVEKCVV